MPLARPSLTRALTAGGAAGAAYLAEQALDRRLLPNLYDDRLLWGALLARSPRRRLLLGLAAHASLSVALATAYQVLLPVLPCWNRVLRGIAFVQIENAVLYPGVPILNAINPAVAEGALPSLLTWRYFWVEILRHLAFGAVLGALIDRPAEVRS